MIQLYQKVTPLRVLAHFFDNPDEGFYLRELARLLDMSPMTLKRSLDMLVEDDLLHRLEDKNRILYRAHVESPAFRCAKLSRSLALIDGTDLLETLLESYPGTSSVVLYGSCARGENDRLSDLDVLVISSKKGTARYTVDLAGPRGVDVNVMSFTGEGWTRQARENRAFYLDVITEGVVLHGTRPVVD
jgi:predicted nucleotidyltransferase